MHSHLYTDVEFICTCRWWNFKEAVSWYAEMPTSGDLKSGDFSSIDRMHKWGPNEYSFVVVLISLTSLVSTDKIQKKSTFRTRLVGLISTKTKEYFFLAAIYAFGLKHPGIELPPPCKKSNDPPSPSNRPSYPQIDLELPLFNLTLQRENRKKISEVFRGLPKLIQKWTEVFWRFSDVGPEN